ncbi:MAG: PKD domain-containing protein, partial [Nitrospirota bacterium]
MMRARQVGVVGVLLMGLCLAGRMAMAHSGGEALSLPTMKPSPASHAVAAQMLGMPLQFEANHGQVDDQVKFLARGKGYTLFLTPTESVMVLTGREASRVKSEAGSDPTEVIGHESQEYKHSVVRMKLEGANPSPTVSGLEPLPGIVNYFIGNDPAKWRTKIPTFVKVNYQEVYPGIDVAYYGNQGRLEYDFIVRPGADPDQIKLAFEGASDVKLVDSGDLLLTTALGEVRVQKPIVYQQEKDGHKTLVAGKYVTSPGNEIGIQLAAYDRNKSVIIDPVLDYATYLGGRLGEADGDIAVDSAGNAYVTGWTASLDFPVTPGSFDPTFNANALCPSISVTNTTCNDPTTTVNLNRDVFVAKINPTGTALVYATYLGGTSPESTGGLTRITVDAAGQAFIVGRTQSPDFPVTAGAFQTAFHNCPPPDQSPASCSTDPFVTKLDASGSTLLYSTFLGGTVGEAAMDVAVDSGGHAFVAIANAQASFPTTTGVLDPACNGAAVAKLNPTGTGLIWSTCLSPAPAQFHEPRGIALDSAGNVIIAGQVQGSLITTVNSNQPFGGVADAFVWKLNPSGTSLVFATFLGGAGRETAQGVAIDLNDNIYVTGHTESANFPVSSGAFDTTYNGGQDSFVVKFNALGNVQFATYLGGSGFECGSICDIGVDSAGQVHVVTDTASADYPIKDAIDSTYNGLTNDVALTILKADGSELNSSTFIGGTGQEVRPRLALLPSGTAFIFTLTGSSNFPITPGAFQSTPNDIAIIRITNRPTANAGPDQSVPEGTLVTLDGTGSTGGSLTYTWTKVAGPPVGLGGATTAHPTFTAPNVPAAGGTVTLELVVCEGTSSNCSDPDTVNVHITDVNHAPVAQAGPDQTVQEGSPVILDGLASYDPDIDPLTYTWLQVFGPPVTLAYPNSATPSFTAPSVGVGGAQVDFELIVTDPLGLNHSDFVSVHISNINQPPMAHAGPDQTKNEQTLVTLDGGGSLDPDLDTLSYSWTQTGGPSVLLTGANTASPTFTAPNVAAGGAFLTFQLVVHDGQASSIADTVQVAVVNVNDPPVCSLAQAS